MYLSDKEIKKLTRRKQGPAQARVLMESNIPFRMVDGRPVVRKDWDAQNMTPPEPKLRLVR